MQEVSQRKVCHDRNGPAAAATSSSPPPSPTWVSSSSSQFGIIKKTKSNYDSSKWGGRRRRRDSPLTVKLRQKRRVLIFMWTLWFAYMSLMSGDEVEAVPPPRLLAPAPGYRSTNRGQNNYQEPPPRLPPSLDEDDREPYASLNWRASRRFSVPTNSKVVPQDTTTTKGVPRSGGEIVNNDKRNVAGPGRRPLLKASLSDYDDDDYYDDDGYDLVSGFNCTPPAILDFPPDLFTQAERRAGAVAIHFIASMYVFYAIAVVCDDYFVPAIEAICGELKMPSDVAGATFMAIATSAPELFTNVIGTFITQGDIGIGTIVGSAVFNILAVCACCGFAAKMALPLDWYPLTRDCAFYLFSVILLLIMLDDEKIFWYEALILVLVYGIYILVMWKNAALKKGADGLAAKFGYRPKERFSYKDISDSSDTETSFEEGEKTEKTPLLSGSDPVPRRRVSEEEEEKKKGGKTTEEDHPHHHHHPDDEFVSREDYDEMLIAKARHRQQEDAEEEEGEGGLCRLPRGESCGVWLEWFLGWPARLAFTLTIPDCRSARYRRWYPLTFIMCIVYIALLSYVVSWLMTVIGHTFLIPDSVMGLTFIAAGTSVPEAVSSIIVARQGLGSMGISNSIGSNTFDILMCLGLPWLIRSVILAAGTEVNFIQINSTGLEYSVIILLVSLLIFYMLLAWNKFYLDRKVATIALLIYFLFLVLSSLFELNVFFPVNLPACRISGSF